MIQRIKSKIYKLILRSEKYTKTDMVYLTKGGYWLTIEKIVSSISAFLLAIAFANLFPAEIYGSYKYILSIISVITILTLPGTGNAVIQAVARGKEGSFLTAFKAKIKWGTLASIGSLGVAGYYWINNNLILAISLLIAAIFLPFMDSFNIYNSFLSGKKLFDISAKFQIISQIIYIFSIITTLFLTRNIFIVLLVYFFSLTISRLIFFKITFRKFKPNQKHDSKIISYAKHLSLLNVFNVLAEQLDKILIFHYFGAAQVAIYYFAIAIPVQIKSPLKYIGRLGYPKFAQRSLLEIKKSIWRKIFLFGLLRIFIVIIYILTAPFIFNLFFPAYKDAVIYSQVFSLSLMVPTGILSYALTAHKKVKELYILKITSSLVLITTLFIGVIYYGIWGAVSARIIYLFFVGITVAVLFQRTKD